MLYDFAAAVDGEDYSIPITAITFTPESVQMMCISITIFSSDLVEYNEVFELHLTVLDGELAPFVLILNVAGVLITDNTGEKVF